MSDDDEVLVRQRLSRLLGGRSIAGERSAVGLLPADTGSADLLPTDTDSAGLLSVDTGSVDTGSVDTGSVDTGSADTGSVGSGPGPSADASAEPGRLAGPGAFESAGPGNFDPGRRGVKALAVVAVLVVLGAAGWAWLSRPRTEPVAGPPASAATFAPTSSTPGSAAGATEVVVAVAGKVRRPGLVRLPAGARVADALESAGGALPGVDVALLNLARRVTDGELILVGVTPPPGAGPPGAPSGAGGPPQAGGGKVNLNTATVAQLDALPGVGPVLAQRIVAHREEHGGFRSVGDLRQVTGIGDARYEDLKDLVTV